jgi:hypothetical protein
MKPRTLAVAAGLLVLTHITAAFAQTDPYALAASQGDMNDLRVILVALGCLACWAFGFSAGDSA